MVGCSINFRSVFFNNEIHVLLEHNLKQSLPQLGEGVLVFFYLNISSLSKDTVNELNTTLISVIISNPPHELLWMKNHALKDMICMSVVEPGELNLEFGILAED